MGQHEIRRILRRLHAVTRNTQNQTVVRADPTTDMTAIRYVYD